MPFVVAVATGVLVVVATALAVEVSARAHSTYRRLLRRNLARDALRAVRARLFRIGMWLPSWPHAIGRLLANPPRVTMATPAREVWRSGRARLTRPTSLPAKPVTEPVVVVHSLITRPWILDLLPYRTLIGGLCDAGQDVYLLDWGDPGRADRMRGWDAYAETLVAATREIAASSPTGRVHLIGYCMGGTLALATVAALGAGPIASLALVAPPVDTFVPGGMGDVLRSPALLPCAGLDGGGNVAPWVVREAFHALRRRTLASAWERLRARSDRTFQAVAGALDRWAWEQRRMPGALFFDLVDFYRGNTLEGGTMRVLGRRADLRAVAVPVLVAVTDHDHIVPVASSLALTRDLRKAPTVVRCPAGHVSMLMGNESRTTLLPNLVSFLRANGAGAVVRTKGS